VLGDDELGAVAERLRTAGVPVAGSLTAEQIAGGRSNLTYRLEDEAQRWVLRTPPRAGRTPSAHDVAREFRVTSALAAAGLPVDEALLRSGGFEPELAREAARELLSHPSPPTAVFAANDLSALATLEVAAELGIDVPRQLSVVGFDNIPESAMADPPLTTVEQPIRRMGQVATAMLLALISGEELPGPHRTLATSVVVRASTAPPLPAS